MFCRLGFFLFAGCLWETLINHFERYISYPNYNQPIQIPIWLNLRLSRCIKHTSRWLDGVKRSYCYYSVIQGVENSPPTPYSRVFAITMYISWSHLPAWCSRVNRTPDAHRLKPKISPNGAVLKQGQECVFNPASAHQFDDFLQILTFFLN